MAGEDPLASWNETETKQALLGFVEKVCRIDGPDYVPPAERIATFDNDGTLWVEKMLYFQILFTLDRVKELLPEHPEWKDTEPFKTVLSGDPDALASIGEKGFEQILMATYGGESIDAYRAIARTWLRTAKHPRFDQPYIELAYLPMIELMDYLRAHEFKVYIASAGGLEFMRSIAEEVYHVPPEKVIGSDFVTTYELREGKHVLIRNPTLFFDNNHANKPVGIHRRIGRRPIMAFGNSDADFEMLEWVTEGDGLRLGAFVHHTDSAREWAYDRDSKMVGTLDKGLDEAPLRGWLLIDMKKDWKQMFSFEKKESIEVPALLKN
ncbi:MAG: HAD family hydrolase [Pontiella sp.]